MLFLGRKRGWVFLFLPFGHVFPNLLDDTYIVSVLLEARFFSLYGSPPVFFRFEKEGD